MRKDESQRWKPRCGPRRDVRSEGEAKRRGRKLDERPNLLVEILTMNGRLRPETSALVYGMGRLLAARRMEAG